MIRSDTDTKEILQSINDIKFAKIALVWAKQIRFSKPESL